MRAYTLFASIVFAIILLAAAIAKLLHPWDLLAFLDRGAAIFEIIFAATLLFFHLKPGIWLLSSLVFASWSGYSLYWTVQELPCTCMGTLVEFPRGFFLGLSLFLLICSLWIAYRLTLSRQIISWFIIFSIALSVFGYYFGNWAYMKFVLPSLAST